MLSVTVHAAKDVRSADPNGLSDPYALVFVGKNKPKKTKIVKKSLNPVWEETFEFPFTRHDRTLQVQVWDWDAIGSDDFLGLVHIDLSPAQDGNVSAVKAGWLKLQQHPNKKNIAVKGGVHISVGLVETKYKAQSSKEVQKVVQGKVQATDTFFDISGVGATAFENSWVVALPDKLEIINCSFNKFSSLPDSLKRFQNLQQIFAAGNQLSAWPAALCRLENLTELEINGNNLSSLPSEIGRMQHLEKLNLANNKLSSLPPTLGYCFRLEDLNLSGNELDTVPDGMGNLYKMEVLDLSCNSLTFLPEELTYCTRLIELNLGGNRLKALPEAVGRLSRVVSLNVSDNHITEFPVSIGYCNSLAQIGQGLNIDRNPLRDPELAQQFRVGADRLFMYLEKRMFIEGSPKLPDFPNGGRLPYVPLPPCDGEILGFGKAGGGTGSQKLGRLGSTSDTYSQSPINMRSHVSSGSGRSSGQPSPSMPRRSPAAVAAAAAPVTRDEKVEKIRTVAKAVIENDIRPKLAALGKQIEAAGSIPHVQPLVLKVKSMKNDFESIKQILPALDKLPTPERVPGEEQLVTLKKVVGVIMFEYDLVMGISLTVIDVASGKDLVTLVGALKKIKALLG